MTENNKPEQKQEAAPKTSVSTNKRTNKNASQTNPTQPKEKIEPIKIVYVVTAASITISVIALITSGWFYYHYKSAQSLLNNNVQQLTFQQTNLNNKFNAQDLKQSQLNTLITQVKQSQQSLQNQKTELTIQQNQQIQQSAQLLSLKSKVNRLNNTTKEDWQLAEAEYLIRLANQRLLLESDSSGAVALLTSADNILNALNDPLCFTTRKALAKDIQALKSVSQFDVEGYYLQIGALYDNVEKLPQREPSKEWQSAIKSKIQAGQTESSTANDVTTTLANLWQSIRSLVVINYHHKPIEALLPPAEYQQLVTRLQLQLDVAQVALIKGETVIYQKALVRVAKAITEHFDNKAKSVTAFLASLTTLQQINPAPKLPLPRNSLVSIKSLMQAWDNRAVNTNNTTNTNTPSSESSSPSEPTTSDAAQNATPETKMQPAPSPKQEDNTAAPENSTDNNTTKKNTTGDNATEDDATGDKA